MSTDAVVEFMMDVDGDHAVEAEVQKLESIEQVVIFARERGYSFTLDDLQAVADRVKETITQPGELSDEQLEGVSGGALFGNAMFSNAIYSNAMFSNSLWGNSLMGNALTTSGDTKVFRKKDD